MGKSTRTYEEKYRLIMDCRQSGLSDASWCRLNEIASSTFYSWVSRLRDIGYAIPDSQYNENCSPAPAQEVVRVEFVQEEELSVPECVSETTSDKIPSDMRKSIDGLCAIVENELHMDPRRSAVYLFCGRRCDRIKILLWEPDGFVLLYKRLAVEGRYKWPRNCKEAKRLTWQQFGWLMSGLDIAALNQTIAGLNDKIASLNKENERLTETVDYLTKKLFGKKSEKSQADPDQVDLYSYLGIKPETEPERTALTP